MSIDSIILKFEKLGNLDVSKPLAKACLVVENAAKEKVPKDTGNLQNSITHEVDGDEGIIGTNVEYAPYVEFGTGLFSSQGDGRKDVPWRYQDAEGNWHTTSGNKPQPYLQPAIQNNRDEIERVFQNAIKEAMK